MGEAGPAAATHAALGQGRVFAVSEADALRDWLTESARTRLEQQDYPLLFWADLGRWVLLAALAPMLLLFRRRSA
jgi:Ca-activated chloride channel family protein